MGDFGNRGAGQKLNLGVGGQQIKMLRLPAGQDVEIKIVAQGCGGDYGVFLVLAGKLDKSVIVYIVDDRPLFNPADLVLLGFHLEEAAAVLQHLQRLAVHHFGHAIGDGVLRGHGDNICRAET